MPKQWGGLALVDTCLPKLMLATGNRALVISFSFVVCPWLHSLWPPADRDVLQFGVGELGLRFGDCLLFL